MNKHWLASSQRHQSQWHTQTQAAPVPPAGLAERLLFLYHRKINKFRGW
jgi:hypothetical protein